MAKTEAVNDKDYPFDGQRLSRGSLRLGFRSLVPYQFQIGSWSPEIGLFVGNEFGVFNRLENVDAVTWKVEAFLICNPRDAFNQEEIRLPVEITEPFNAAARTRIRVYIDKTIREGPGNEIVFRVIGNSKPIVPVLPGHAVEFLTRPILPDEDADKEDFLSCKRMVVPVIPFRKAPRLLIGEAGSMLGIGGKVWDGSVAMLEFLFATEDRWSKLGLSDPRRNLNILDLGSGTGVLGCGLGLLLPSVTVINTDLPDVVPLIEMNSSTISNVRAEAYVWGEEPCSDSEVKLKSPFDVVFMCDVVYDDPCYAPLLKTLRILKAKNVLMSHRHRNKSEIQFFTELTSFCKLECIKYPVIEATDPYHAILKLATKADYTIEERFSSSIDDLGVFRLSLL